MPKHIFEKVNLGRYNSKKIEHYSRVARL